jgi:hypothetical protein
MDPVTIGLLGVLAGAVIGFAGSGFAAYSAFRASELQARLPLIPRIHTLGFAFVRLSTAKGTADENPRRLDFESAWNDFRVHQQVLCPSIRIELLAYLLQRASRERDLNLVQAADLSGQFLDKITRMVGARSKHIFRWRANREERAIMLDWLESPESQALGAELRVKLRHVAKKGTIPN